MPSFFSIAAPLIGGVIQGGLEFLGARNQSRAIERSSASSNAIVQRELDRIRADEERRRVENAPFLQTSTDAINRLRDMFVTGKTPIATDPGYKFRVAEGNKALDRSAASRGQLLSGGQIRAATDLNQNLATNESNNVFNRLRSLSTGGQNAPIGQGGANLAVNIGNTSQNAAQLAAEARRSGFTGVGNAVTDTLNNYLTLDVLRKRGLI